MFYIKAVCFSRKMPMLPIFLPMPWRSRWQETLRERERWVVWVEEGRLVTHCPASNNNNNRE